MCFLQLPLQLDVLEPVRTDTDMHVRTLNGLKSHSAKSQSVYLRRHVPNTW